ncbi:MAG: Ig-like domain-containing protein [Candidatus Eremiobacteraeota bacterium]|nr:Ig-like domain-containing protein [Candidatus Eremiobacteraeota bacterium]
MRAIPQDISSLRITGLGGARQVTFGPATYAKAARIVVTGVPVNTVEIHIEYLRNGVLRGIYTGPVSLQAGQDFVLNDPAFLDVEAQLVRLEISPGLAVVPTGLSLQLRATGVFNDNSRSDLTETVGWSASNGNLVVSNSAGTKGLIRGIAQGSAEVTATLSSVSGSLPVSITAAQLRSLSVTGTPTRLPRGTAVQLSSQGTLSDGTQIDLTQGADWSSSDHSKLSVNKGLVSALNPGTASAIASVSGIEGRLELTVVSATLSALEVSPNPISLPLGLSTEVSVLARFSDGTTLDVTGETGWVSDQPSVGTVMGGRFQARGVGSATLTASYGGLSRTVPATVTAAVAQSLEIRYGLPQLPTGTREPLLAFAHYSDNSDREVTKAALWDSQNPERARVSNSFGEEGVATGISPGTAEIRARLDAVTASYSLVVGNRALFVKNDASPGGDGSFSRPLTNLAAAVDQAPVNTTIFVFAGDGTNSGYQQAVQLKNGQRVIGQAQGYASLNVPAGPAPQLSGTVNMAQNSSLAGVHFQAVSQQAVRADSVANVTLDQVQFDRCGLDAVSIHNPAGLTLRNSSFAAPLEPQAALRIDCAPDYQASSEIEVGNCTFDGYASSEVEPLIEVAMARNSLTPVDQSLRLHDNLFRNHRGYLVKWSGNEVRWNQLHLLDNTIENCGTLLYSNSASNSSLVEMRLEGNEGTLQADFVMQNTPQNVTVGRMTVLANRVSQYSGSFQRLQVASCQNGTVANNQVTFLKSGALTYLLDGYLTGSTPGPINLTVTNNIFSGPFTFWDIRTAGDGLMLLNIKNNVTDCLLTLIESRYAGGLDFSGNSGRVLELTGGLVEPFRVEQASSLRSVNSYSDIVQTRITDAPDGSLNLP